MDPDRPRGHSKPCTSIPNGRTSKDLVNVPKVVIENPAEDSSGFSSSVVKVLSMQRFYTKSVRRSRESWLQKYAYHRANEEREWRRPLVRKSPSPSPQPESPCTDQNASELCHDEEHDSNENTAGFQGECCMPFVLEPSGKLYFWWLVIVSLAVMYNFYAIILYVAFSSIYVQNTNVCFGIDYAFDSIFVLDILIQFRTGFLQHGILERRSKKLAVNYVKSKGFLLDVIAVIPFDLLYFVVGLYPILRANRLLKVRRFFLFCDRGEIYSGRPKLFNLLKLILYLLLIIHWVACLYFILSRFEGFGQDEWIHPRLEGKWSEVGMQYLYSLHRSSVIMTTVGTITIPRTNLTMVFGCFTYLCGVLIFASVVGNAGDMINDMRRHRERYLRKLNGMKAYVSAHQIPAQLTKRVIQWYDYMWTHKRDMDEDQLFANLNDNFRAEIAIHVNLETLIKVEMFKVCDPGFLHDLVLKLRPMICSPGDFICREGEKGREMYIVNKGNVEVLDEKETILATLKAGSHFGEISLLNMKGIGDRRTASVRSLGFTDLFRLSKDDLEEVLEFYPDEKKHMERIATKTFEKQQRERNLAKNKEELNTGDTEVPRDPREWLAADTKTLRRRLSWISGVNTLRKFASRVKQNESPGDQSSNNILKEFSEKARKQRSDEECRRIIQDFVADIHERDPPVQNHKPSIQSEDSFFTKSSPDWLISRSMNESLRKNRKRTKRSSYSLAEGTPKVPGSCNTIFRQRSNTLGPLSNTRDLLNFQTLETSPKKPAMNYGSTEVRIKPILKKTSTFGQVKSNPTANKENQKTLKGFVLSTEPLVSMHFKDIARNTMEKRRKWFEGENIDSKRETAEQDQPDFDESPRQNQINENQSVTCTCVVENMASSIDAFSSTSSGHSPVWEHQKEDAKCFKRQVKHYKDTTKPLSATVLQNYNCDSQLESEEETIINDGYLDEAQLFVNNKGDDSSKTTGPTKPQSLKSVHEDVECACSAQKPRANLSQAHNNNEVIKKPVGKRASVSTAKDGRSETFPKESIEETCC